MKEISRNSAARCTHAQGRAGHVGNDLLREYWGGLKMGVPKNACFMMETPIKIDDVGAPFLESSYIIKVFHGNAI